MNKMMIAIAGAAVSAAVNANDMQNVFDFMRQVNAAGATDFANNFEYLDKCSKATETGMWEEAARYMKRYIEHEKTGGVLRVDYNLAGDYVWLAMLQWNNGERSAASGSMEEAARLMKHGENLGGGCEKLAEKFLVKMRSGDLPSRFTSSDIFSQCGVRHNIMAPAKARFDECLNASIARSNMMISRIDSEIRTHQMLADRQARMARQSARQEYLRSTGCEFSPDRSTRPSYGKARDEWDACKRVYDIFEN